MALGGEYKNLSNYNVVLNSMLQPANPFSKINDFRQVQSDEGNNPDCVRKDITLTYPASDSQCVLL